MPVEALQHDLLLVAKASVPEKKRNIKSPPSTKSRKEKLSMVRAKHRSGLQVPKKMLSFPSQPRGRPAHYRCDGDEMLIDEGTFPCVYLYRH